MLTSVLMEFIDMHSAIISPFYLEKDVGGLGAYTLYAEIMTSACSSLQCIGFTCETIRVKDIYILNELETFEVSATSIQKLNISLM